MRSGKRKRKVMVRARQPEDEAELDGFQRRWLSACAAYPVLRWQLTVYFGRRLAEADNVAPPDMGAHAPLFCLPWFRQGYMPGPTRERLLAAMDETDRRTVRRALEDILQQGRGGVGPGSLHPADEDLIFLQFMLGERAKPADRLFDAVLARLAPRWRRRGVDGRLVRGGVAALAAAVVLVGGVWLVTRGGM